MTRAEIISFAATNPACHLATVDENGAPHVRGMYLYRADDNGFVFHTGTFKHVCRQIEHDPRAEICFSDLRQGIQVRVAGRLERLDDQAFKEEIVADPTRAFLRPWIEKNGYDQFVVYRLPGGTATVWTMATNFAPAEQVDI